MRISLRESATNWTALVGVGLVALLNFGLGLQAEEKGLSVVDRWDQAGDLSLDNGTWKVVFARKESAVRLFDLSAARPVETLSLVPLDRDETRATGMTACQVLESTPDRVRCRVAFSAKTGPLEGTFAFTRKGALQVQPGAGLEGVSVAAPFQYGVLPSRQLDDDVYDASHYADLTHLYLPSENLFLGLLKGGNGTLVCAWPSGGQSARMVLGGPAGKRRLEAFELRLAGQEVFVGAFSAPGLWHEVQLQPDFEEQDVKLDWQPPFEAMWKTQLTELGVPTTFRFLDERWRPWRPTVGFYTHPFFAEGNQVFLTLHKKLAAEGKALIYALEGHENTPYSFLMENLPLEEQRKITDLSGVEHYYALDPDPIPGGPTVDAHCAGRDQFQFTTLTAGAQAREVELLETHIDERVHECQVIATYHVQRSLTCMQELTEQINRWLAEQAGRPGVSSFLHSLQDTLNAMQQEYRERLGGETPEDIMKGVHRAAGKYRSVIHEDAGVELCPEILSYINELNGVISLQEDEGRRFGTWARQLFQQAGYDCVRDREAVPYAESIRQSLREFLRYRGYETPGPGYPPSLLPSE